MGDLRPGTTCEMRRRILGELGHRIRPIDTSPAPRSPLAAVLDRARGRLGYPTDGTGANRRVREAVDRAPPDVLWVDNPQILDRRTLAHARARGPTTRRVAFIMDDPCGPRAFVWRRFREAVGEYDLVLVIRDENLRELAALGAKRVVRYHKGFDPQTHRPVTLPPDAERHDVLFAGHWEPKREEDIAHLLRNGIDVTVMGDASWRRGRHWKLVRRGFRPAQLGEPYVRALCASRIALNFYSQWNRDTENSRMYEIAACGSFLLSERNLENVRIFGEGEEAEFFDDRGELLAKVRRHLADEGLRRRIAEAGRRRCLEGGYDYTERLRSVLELLEEDGGSEEGQPS